MLLRKELADSRRAYQLAQSLDEIVGDRGITPGDLISAETEAQADLRLALESVFRILTPLQQKIWHLLGQGYRVAEIARVVRRPRRTVRDEISKIGHIFSQRGLNKNR